MEHGTTEESSSAADAEDFLRRAFPEPQGDEETPPRNASRDDGSLYRSDVAEATQSAHVDTLLTLGRQCAQNGDWSGVQGVLDAVGSFEPTREDQMRAVGVFHAVERRQPNVARSFADGMEPGRAQDGWRRYAEGDAVELPQHHVGRYDGLWGIAEQYLGDGRRWREIRDINVGRPQPDGSRLAADGTDIRQGWTLVLPPDAERTE